MTYPEAMDRLASAEGVTQEMVDAIEGEMRRLNWALSSIRAVIRQASEDTAHDRGDIVEYEILDRVAHLKVTANKVPL